MFWTVKYVNNLYCCSIEFMPKFTLINVYPEYLVTMNFCCFKFVLNSHTTGRKNTFSENEKLFAWTLEMKYLAEEMLKESGVKRNLKVQTKDDSDSTNRSKLFETLLCLTNNNCEHEFFLFTHNICGQKL